MQNRMFIDGILCRLTLLRPGQGCRSYEWLVNEFYQCGITRGGEASYEGRILGSYDDLAAVGKLLEHLSECSLALGVKGLGRIV